MKKLVLPLLLLSVLVLDGCKFGPGCDVENAAANTIASAVSTAGSCANVTLMQADLAAYFQSKLNLCTADVKAGAIAMIVCPVAVGWLKHEVQTLIASGAFAKRYDCTGANLATAVTGVLVAGCELLPF